MPHGSASYESALTSVVHFPMEHARNRPLLLGLQGLYSLKEPFGGDFHS